MLDALPVVEDRRLLTGFENSEDAAVFRLDEERGIVFTIDVITPLVDDPELYGAIAAANALSDVYAMGGRGLISLSFLGTPAGFPEDVGAAIAKGGADLALAEGAPVVGGHSVESKDLMYGLAVVGLAAPDAVFSNDGYEVGHDLVLTKPLGTGTLTTALKARKIEEAAVEDALAGMRQTNRAAVSILLEHGVRAATDVTGFGLLGHAAEIARASDVRIVIAQSRVPDYPGAREALRKGYVTRGNRSNLEYVRTLGPLEGEAEALLFDPQTSGGLLVGASASCSESLVAGLRDAGFEATERIGVVEAGSGVRID